MSNIEDRVIKQIKDRAKIGKGKYGVTMERDDLSLLEWIQHLQEELLDAAVYVERLKGDLQEEIEQGAVDLLQGDCDCNNEYCPCKEDLLDERMEIIGRNGNTGDHYDALMNIDVSGPITIYPESNQTNTYEIQEKKGTSK